MPERSGRPGRSDRRQGAGRDVVVVLGVFVVLGVLCGVLWSQVVTPASFTRLARGGSMGEDEIAKQFAADGWFVVIGAVTGLVAGFVLCWSRTRDVLVTCLLVVAGAVVAGVLMAAVGHLLGPGSTRSALAAAKVGQKVPEQLGLGTRPVSPIGPYLRDTVTFYLVWPVGALLGAFFVLIGRAPESSDSSSEPQAESSGLHHLSAD